MANPVDKMLEHSFTPDPLLGSDSFIYSDPNQQTQPDPIRATDAEVTPPPGYVAAGDVGGRPDPNHVPGSDPLLGSDAFIAVEGGSDAPFEGRSDPNSVPGSDPLLGSDAFIAVEGGSNSPKAKRTKKGTEDGGETLGWLPAGWTITSKTRANGATAGTVDRYYVDPASGQRFRSKIEVKRYLETGSRKKSNSDASATRSKKTGAKKKEAAWSFDFENPPEEVTWSLVDEDQGLWKPLIGEEVVPETTAQEWAATFERMCQME